MSRASRHIERRALFASGAAAALLAATGVSAGPSPVRGGRLRMALSGAARTDQFDSRLKMGVFMQVAMAGLVFDTLTEVAADGTLRGELATAWQGSADARSWTFDLRRAVQFHNGAHFTARDVAASLEMHRAGLLTDLDRIETINDTQLRIHLKLPDSDFPYRLSDARLVIYPADDVEQAMRDGIGTGVYRLHRFLPGRQVIGQRVDRHYKDGTAGWFDTVELVSIPSDLVRIEALQDGFVDVADVSGTDLSQGLAGFALLPDARHASTAAHEKLRMPLAVGTRAPLDNFRAAERWWMG
ncbi:ABC transporter substrate-binding protein [Roseobacter sp.]|uniref:ABC transporter substrate-binding protein n=1 Tax=Roseobacter sp. TaxID=1907202 RepID=UPI00329A0AAD